MTTRVAWLLDVAPASRRWVLGWLARPDRSLEHLEPIYRRLLDEPVTTVFTVAGTNGRPDLDAQSVRAIVRGIADRRAVARPP